MKRLHILAIGLAISLPAVCYGAGGVAGSVHDFSTNSWQARGGVCAPCHQAHHTDPAQIAPLWAHATSVGPFTPYSGPTMQAVVGQPNNASLACLSCHDGTVAINQGINGPITNATDQTLHFIDPGAQIGPDLHTTHPISFTYNAALAVADPGLEDPTVYTIGSPKTYATYQTAPVPPSWSGTSLTGKTIDQALLIGGKMECASCHDVHKLDGSAPTSGILARISGQDSGGKGSLLCRTCHKK